MIEIDESKINHEFLLTLFRNPNNKRIEVGTWKIEPLFQKEIEAFENFLSTIKDVDQPTTV